MKQNTNSTTKTPLTVVISESKYRIKGIYFKCIPGIFCFFVVLPGIFCFFFVFSMCFCVCFCALFCVFSCCCCYFFFSFYLDFFFLIAFVCIVFVFVLILLKNDLQLILAIFSVLFLLPVWYVHNLVFGDRRYILVRVHTNITK